MISELLNIILEVSSQLNIKAVIIGGLALPAYNVARTTLDIDDILKIIIANKDSLDWEYLRFGLKWVDLEDDFKEILKGFELDFNHNIRNISKDILNKFS